MSDKAQFKIGSLPFGTLLNGRYEFVAEIGEGGFATVYKARDIELGRDVAIKVIKSMELDSKQDILRFTREARSLAQLNHENIITVYSVEVVADKYPAIVMEFLEGASLQSSISNRGTLKYEQFRKIFTQVCSALSYAHELKIAHRDLSTINIFLLNTSPGENPKVKLIDFGLAKFMERYDSQTSSKSITRTGVVVGTPAYMSPEQCRGDSVDHRSDIYSLGCTMYECVSGHPAVEDADPIQVLIKQQAEMPVAPQFSWADLEKEEFAKAVILKCLQKDRESRFESSAEISQILNNPDNVKNIDLTKLAPWKDSARRRKNKLLYAASIPVLLLAFITLIESDWFIRTAAKALSSSAPDFLTGYRVHLAKKLIRKEPEIACSIYESLASKRPIDKDTATYIQALTGIYLEKADFRKAQQVLLKLEECQQAGFHAEIRELTSEYKLLDLNSSNKQSSEQEILTRTELMKAALTESENGNKLVAAMLLPLVQRTRMLADSYFLRHQRFPDGLISQTYSALIPAFRRSRVKSSDDNLVHLPQPQNTRMCSEFEKAVLAKTGLRAIERESLVISLSAHLIAEKKLTEAKQCIVDYINSLGAVEPSSLVNLCIPLAQAEAALGNFDEARKNAERGVSCFEEQIRESGSLERYRTSLIHLSATCWQAAFMEEHQHNAAGVNALCRRIMKHMPLQAELHSLVPFTAHELGVNSNMKLGAPKQLLLGNTVEIVDNIHANLETFATLKQNDLVVQLLKYYKHFLESDPDLSNQYLNDRTKWMEQMRWNDSCANFIKWASERLYKPETGAEEKALLKRCIELRRKGILESN